VKDALQRLAQHLKNKGAVVRIVRLPNDNGVKVGIDDYLAGGHGLADAERLIEPYEPDLPYFGRVGLWFVESVLKNEC